MFEVSGPRPSPRRAEILGGEHPEQRWSSVKELSCRPSVVLEVFADREVDGAPRFEAIARWSAGPIPESHQQRR